MVYVDKNMPWGRPPRHIIMYEWINPVPQSRINPVSKNIKEAIMG